MRLALRLSFKLSKSNLHALRILHHHIAVFRPSVVLHPSFRIQVSEVVAHVVVHLDDHDYSVPSVDHHVPRIAV